MQEDDPNRQNPQIYGETDVGNHHGFPQCINRVSERCQVGYDAQPK
jgi:hypothetical protein